MTHPNDARGWPEIRCTRDHPEFHATRKVRVDLAHHAYPDLPQIPRRLVRAFDLLIWDVRQYPVDGGPYCPAHDAVSETILSHGVWEPIETTLALHVCASAEPEQGMIDVGAQLGWYSMLAASCGLPVVAIDADPECVRVIGQSARLNLWGGLVDAVHLRVDGIGMRIAEDSPVRFAKIDVEGAEDQAVRMLWPAIEAGNVDHLLIEVSPVFADYYPRLLHDLIGAGYRAYRLPEKSRRPEPIVDPEAQLRRIDTMTPAGLEEWVSGCHQANVWLRREGADW